MLKITVKTMDSQSRSFDVPDQTTVKDFKARISSEVAVQPDRQRLIFQGRVLSDDFKLSKDHDGKVIHLVQRLPVSSSSVAASSQSTATTSTPQAPTGGAGSNATFTTNHLSQIFQQALGGLGNVMRTGGNVPVISGTVLSSNGSGNAEQTMNFHIEMGPNNTPVMSQSSAPPVNAPSHTTQSIGNQQSHEQIHSAPRRQLNKTKHLLHHLNQVLAELEKDSPSDITSAPSGGENGPEVVVASAGNTEQEAGEPSSGENEGNMDTSPSPSTSSTTGGSRGNSHPTLPELGEVYSELAQTQRRLEPFLDFMSTFLNTDPPFNSTESAEFRSTSRRLSHVLKAQQLTSQIHHQLSQVAIPLARTPPRVMLVRAPPGVAMHHGVRAQMPRPPPQAQRRPHPNTRPLLYPPPMTQQAQGPPPNGAQFRVTRITTPFVPLPTQMTPGIPPQMVPPQVVPQPAPIRPVGARGANPGVNSHVTVSPPTYTVQVNATIQPNIHIAVNQGQSTATTSQRLPQTNIGTPQTAASNQSVPQTAATNRSVPQTAATNQSVPQTAASNRSVPQTAATNQSVPQTAATNQSVPQTAASNPRMPRMSTMPQSQTFGPPLGIQMPAFPNIPGVPPEVLTTLMNNIHQQVQGNSPNPIHPVSAGVVIMEGPQQHENQVASDISNMMGEAVYGAVFDQLSGAAPSGQSVVPPGGQSAPPSGETAVKEENKEGEKTPASKEQPQSSKAGNNERPPDVLSGMLTGGFGSRGESSKTQVPGPSSTQKAKSPEVEGDSVKREALDVMKNEAKSRNSSEDATSEPMAPDFGALGSVSWSPESGVTFDRLTLAQIVTSAGHNIPSTGGGLLDRLLRACGELLEAEDCKELFHMSNHAPLNKIKDALKTFISKEYFKGKTPNNDDIQMAVEILSESFRNDVERFFRGAKVIQDVDIVESNLSLHRCFVRKTMQALFQEESSSFASRLGGHVRLMLATFIRLNEHLLKGGRKSLRKHFEDCEDILTGESDPIPRMFEILLYPTLVAPGNDRILPMFDRLVGLASVNQDQIDQFVISHPTPKVKLAHSSNENDDNKEEETPKKSWKNELPSEWVETIVSDIEKQHSMAPQPPFSEAYLSGMPASKRRKVVS